MTLNKNPVEKKEERLPTGVFSQTDTYQAILKNTFHEKNKRH